MGNRIFPLETRFYPRRISDEFFGGFIFHLENQKQPFYKALKKIKKDI